MSANVKPANSPLLATRLERLRLQAVASDAAKALARLVGANIRTARLEKGLNGRQLAEALKDLDPRRAPVPQRVSDWERGVQKPDDGYLGMLSEVLGHPVAWFYTDHAAADETPDLLDELGPHRLERMEQELQVILGVLERQVGADVLAAVRADIQTRRKSGS